MMHKGFPLFSDDEIEKVAGPANCLPYKQRKDAVKMMIELVREKLADGHLFEATFRQGPDPETLEKLRGLGYVKGVSVRDWKGDEGVIPDEAEWLRGVYPYVIGFARPDGVKIWMTNGVVFSTKLA